MEHAKSSTSFPEEAVRGFPNVYARKLQTVTMAHQGLGRIALRQSRLELAEEHISAAIDIMKSRGHSPVFSSNSLARSYEIAQDIYAKNGATGRAIMAKLNGDLLKDYLNSEGGIEDGKFEKDYLFGETTEENLKAVQDFVRSVNDYRSLEARQTQMAVMSGLMYANAAFTQFQADKAIAKSGGVMTPKVQRLQRNAQQSLSAAQNFTELVMKSTGDANAVTGSIRGMVVPTYSQQIVDPRISVHAPGLVKGFATHASQLGGPSFQMGAKQVIDAVDALIPYRQAVQGDSAAAQVGQFVEVLGDFMKQVESISSSGP